MNDAPAAAEHAVRVGALRDASAKLLAEMDPVGTLVEGMLQAAAEGVETEDAFVALARQAHRAEAARRSLVFRWWGFLRAHPGEYLLVQGSTLLAHAAAKHAIAEAFEALDAPARFAAVVIAPGAHPDLQATPTRMLPSPAP